MAMCLPAELHSCMAFLPQEWPKHAILAPSHARNSGATIGLDIQPKSYIHPAGIMTGIMKHWILISLLIIILAGGSEGTMYLYGGSDAYGQGLGYPSYGTPLTFSAIVPGNNTTTISPVLLMATIYRPEARFQRDQNATSHYHSILPVWNQFSFYLPFLSGEDWSFGSYTGYAPSMRNFLKEDWSPAGADYETSAVRKFMQSDSFDEGVQPHNDPTRLGMNHFLDSDEPPGRPLL